MNTTLAFPLDDCLALCIYAEASASVFWQLLKYLTLGSKKGRKVRNLLNRLVNFLSLENRGVLELLFLPPLAQLCRVFQTFEDNCWPWS